jgi:excisionase family DNA binding protein
MNAAPVNVALFDGERPSGAPAGSRPSLAVPLLTASEAAELLAVRTSWVYEAVREGRLPCLRVGRRCRRRRPGRAPRKRRL